MENKIAKPMSVIRFEFIQSLTDLINESALPPFVLEDVLKDAYSRIRVISQKQLESDMQNYQSALEAVANKNISI